MAAPHGSRVGDILIDMGACTQADIDGALETVDGLLGEALIDLGIITRCQLEIALMRQQIDHTETGPEDMRRLVHEQSSMLHLELSTMNGAIRALTMKLAKKNGI